MKNIWVKSLFITAILSPVSIYLHELGHWIIYEINGIDSWISLQRVNLIDPNQITEDIFLKSLFGGPIVTIILALGSYLLLTKYRDSLWLMVLGLLNASQRIMPTIIGAIKSFTSENLSGFSDEGNIALRITESLILREMMMFLLLCFYIVIIIKLYKTFNFPHDMKLKKLFIVMMCALPILIGMILPKLDFLIFGV